MDEVQDVTCVGLAFLPAHSLSLYLLSEGQTYYSQN